MDEPRFGFGFGFGFGFVARWASHREAAREGRAEGDGASIAEARGGSGAGGEALAASTARPARDAARGGRRAPHAPPAGRALAAVALRATRHQRVALLLCRMFHLRALLHNAH